MSVLYADRGETLPRERRLSALDWAFFLVKKLELEEKVEIVPGRTSKMRYKNNKVLVSLREHDQTDPESLFIAAHEIGHAEKYQNKVAYIQYRFFAFFNASVGVLITIAHFQMKAEWVTIPLLMIFVALMIRFADMYEQDEKEADAKANSYVKEFLEEALQFHFDNRDVKSIRWDLRKKEIDRKKIIQKNKLVFQMLIPFIFVFNIIQS